MAIRVDAINVEHLQMNCKEKPDFPGVDIPNMSKNTLFPMNINFKMPIAFTMLKNGGLLFPKEIKCFVDVFLAKHDLHVSTKRERPSGLLFENKTDNHLPLHEIWDMFMAAYSSPEFSSAFSKQGNGSRKAPCTQRHGHACSMFPMCELCSLLERNVGNIEWMSLISSLSH